MAQQDTISYPVVSVITVTYNAAGMLERTLRSVEAQQYGPMETIIVDGGSTDGTTGIIHAHAAHVTRWVSEPDGGIYDAMNKGVAMATGGWVIFMNAGDTFAADDVLKRLFAKRHEESDIIYGDVVKDGGVKKAPSEYRPYHRMLFCHQSSLTRRRLLLDSPFDVSHRYSADLKFFLIQYYRHARFEYVGLPIADFDTTGVSNSHRSAGLADNIRVVCETMPLPLRLKSVIRLMVPYLVCRIRGK